MWLTYCFVLMLLLPVGFVRYTISSFDQVTVHLFLFNFYCSIDTWNWDATLSKLRSCITQKNCIHLFFCTVNCGKTWQKNLSSQVVRVLIVQVALLHFKDHIEKLRFLIVLIIFDFSFTSASPFLLLSSVVSPMSADFFNSIFVSLLTSWIAVWSSCSLFTGIA